MKKTLLASLLLSLAAASASAQVFWYDSITNRPGGCITTNASSTFIETDWFPHYPGTFTATDALVITNTYTSGAAVSGERLRLNGANAEYIMRLFDPVNTNANIPGGVVYASFVVNAASVPAAGAGTYFACFAAADPNVPPASITNDFEFRGRVFQIGNTNVYPFPTTTPATYQFAVANAENDPAQSNPGPQAYVPIDLVANVDYQVVLKYDIGNVIAYLYVNPGINDEYIGWAYAEAYDSGIISNALAGLLFRQRTGGAIVDIRDIAVGPNFTDVVTNVAASSPVLIATNYNTVSSYVGEPALLEVFASSIGGSALSYQWYQITTGGATNLLSGANSQTYYVPSLAGSGSDAGNYFCAVTNSGGQGAVSTTNFSIAVNLTLTAPFFVSQPQAAIVSVSQTATFSALASGTGPLTYQWKHAGTNIYNGTPGWPADTAVISGATTPYLTIANCSFFEAGSYTCVVTTSAATTPQSATSTPASLTVNPTGQPVTIAYLRSLSDSNPLDGANYWQPTNTTTIYSITGVVTVYTNCIGYYAGESSYYIQDGTAGINLLYYFNSPGNVPPGSPDWRPQMGDIVTAIGALWHYYNNIEQEVQQDYYTYEYCTVIGHTNCLPAPVVISPLWTNNPPLMETNIEGRLIMLTNVYFVSTTNTSSTGATTTLVTDSSGAFFTVYFAGNSDPDVRSRPLPSFAYTLTGVCFQDSPGSTKYGPYTNAGYMVCITRWADVVTTPPPAPTVSAALSGNNVVLTWTAVPYNIAAGGGGGYAYSVQSSANVGGPYTPLATGLTFSTAAGCYTDTNAVGAQKYYLISSP